MAPPILNVRQLIPEVGRHLYGEYGWQKPLAKSLWHPDHDRPGTDLSTMIKWMNGRRPVPGWVAGELLRLVREGIELRKEEAAYLIEEAEKKVRELNRRKSFDNFG